MKTRIVSFVLLALVLAASLSACQAQPKVVEGAEADQIIATADPMAEEVLQAMEAGDYARFSANFDKALAGSLTETAFNDMRSMFQEKLGAYQTKEAQQVQVVDEFNAIIYNLTYANAPEVTMRFVLTQGEDPKVSGLWFDSPELRAK